MTGGGRPACVVVGAGVVDVVVVVGGGVGLNLLLKLSLPCEFPLKRKIITKFFKFSFCLFTLTEVLV